jgi:hypothetical protein
MKIHALALLLAVSTTAAVAAEGNGAPAPTTVKKEKPKKICKNDNRLTGTRISKRICKTQEEWDKDVDGQDVGIKSKGGRLDTENIGGMNQP